MQRTKFTKASIFKKVLAMATVSVSLAACDTNDNSFAFNLAQTKEYKKYVKSHRLNERLIDNKMSDDPAFEKNYVRFYQLRSAYLVRQNCLKGQLTFYNDVKPALDEFMPFYFWAEYIKKSGLAQKIEPLNKSDVFFYVQAADATVKRVIAESTSHSAWSMHNTDCEAKLWSASQKQGLNLKNSLKAFMKAYYRNNSNEAHVFFLKEPYYLSQL